MVRNTMKTYYEGREAADPEERENYLLRSLPKALNRAREHAPAIADQLKGIDVNAIITRKDLARIPVVRKSELLHMQSLLRTREDAAGQAEEQRVFGGFSTIGWGEAKRVFASPGPIYEPESERPDYWGFARALYAAGFRPRDLIHNCFSYHFTPAGSMMETAAHALGCTVFPGGTGQTEQQIRAMLDLKPAGYTGTPSFLKIIMEHAAETGEPITLQHALFSGEAFPPSLRDWFAERGLNGYQAYGSADLGMIAYETTAREGLVVNEGVLLEIVRPGTHDAVPLGEVGEVVVTTLNPDYPLVRFGTGDLSAIMPGQSPCGRTNMRIKGWMGRADQTTKVRGMFVHPEQVAGVAKRHPEIVKARLVVSGATGNDQMTLKVELASMSEEGLDSIAESVRELTKLRATIEPVDRGTLPNDGLVIADLRSYE